MSRPVWKRWSWPRMDRWKRRWNTTLNWPAYHKKVKGPAPPTRKSLGSSWRGSRVYPLEVGGDWGGGGPSPHEEDSKGTLWCNMHPGMYLRGGERARGANGWVAKVLSIKLFQEILLAWSQYLKARRVGRQNGSAVQAPPPRRGGRGQGGRPTGYKQSITSPLFYFSFLFILSFQENFTVQLKADRVLLLLLLAFILTKKT